ncbi:hypothetical protein AMELA_G00081510 [Ameiurus melas]|uniref:Uncharacterized protein n=1 Tax=Ameiurus melas TaxID=219545 RepID=A0A7J6B1Z1_AMEME|nr:hypothetical protein AMELA_G00081510 [Ameiurus melas]
MDSLAHHIECRISARVTGETATPEAPTSCARKNWALPDADALAHTRKSGCS